VTLRVLLDEFPEDPYLNLAIDEALLIRGNKLPILRIWRNDNSVILGRMSRIDEEVNVEFAKAKGIKIARRITGGGTVFHDMGNVNYTIIVKKDNKEGIEFLYDFLLKGVVNAIRKIVDDASLVDVYNDTDVAYKGFKVSGNAGYLTKDKALLHGSLLISANIELLYKVLIIPPKNFEMKKRNINMIKYRVNNLNSLMNKEITYEEVIRYLISSFSNLLNLETQFDRLSNEELQLANELKESKYSKPSFIFMT